MYVFEVPYDEGGGKKSLGAREGPDAIERQLRKWSWRGSEDGTKNQSPEFINVVSRSMSKENVFDSLGAAIRLTLSLGAKSFVTLSGDNSVSFYTTKFVAEFSPDPYLVVMDAHLDACDFSHDPHASWVRKLWEEGIVKAERTFFFGVRDPEQAEMSYVKEKGATIFSPSEIDRVGPQALVSNLLLFKKLVATKALVLVVDIDVLDPVFAPGTGVLRSGGLHIRQALQLIKIFGELPFPLKIGEVSEVIPHDANILRHPNDPRPDPVGLTVLSAEAILREMIRRFS